MSAMVSLENDSDTTIDISGLQYLNRNEYCLYLIVFVSFVDPLALRASGAFDMRQSVQGDSRKS